MRPSRWDGVWDPGFYSSPAPDVETVYSLSEQLSDHYRCISSIRGSLWCPNSPLPYSFSACSMESAVGASLPEHQKA